MLYPFMTLNDNTEIVHSEILENSGKEEVEVRIEKPVQGGFYECLKYDNCTEYYLEKDDTKEKENE